MLVVAGIAMLALLLFISRWLTFWLDEWDFIFGRPDPSLNSIFQPQVGTLVATPAVVYQALLHAFGLRTYLPYLLVDWAAHFVCVGLLYRVVARLSGKALGLMAGLSLLLLGSAFEDLLQPFQMLFLFAAGGGLLALDRLLAVQEDPAGAYRRIHVLVAALALVFAVASSNVGPIFVGLIVIWAALGRDRGALLSTVPAIVFYGTWYWLLATGSYQPGSTTDVIVAVESLVYGLGAAACGVLGLAPGRFAWFGAVVLATAAFGVGWAVIRGLRPAPLAVAALMALIAEYILQGFLRGSLGLDHAARSGYLYPAAIFIWLTVSGLAGRSLDPVRWRDRGRLAVVPLLTFLLIVPMVAGNMVQFIGAAQATRQIRATELAELRLLEAVRQIPGVDPNISPDTDYIPQVSEQNYFGAIDRFGSPDLPGDWESQVDVPRFNSAAVRLLSMAIRSEAPPASGGSPNQLSVTGATVAPGASSGCLTVQPTSADTVVSTSIANGQAFWLLSPPPDVKLVVSVMGPPSANANAAMNAVVASGQATALPGLPAPYGWHIEFVSLGTQKFQVCTGTAY